MPSDAVLCLKVYSESEAGMKERPILFSGEMVRAILEGRKTQTRRIVKFKQCGMLSTEFCSEGFDVYRFDHQYSKLVMSETMPCPYGQPGDRLWVRETWQAVHFEKDFETGICDDWYHARHIPKLSNDGYWKVCYEADGTWPKDRDERGFPFRPSIHMPRWASRITLEITNIRVERLQDISEEDALAEGVTGWTEPGQVKIPVGLGTQHGRQMQDGNIRVKQSPIYQFQDLWESINGPGSWEKNPWVWVINFKVVKP